jgi:hypothetical protein
MASPALKAAPSPAEIDLKAVAYTLLEEELRRAKADLADAAKPLSDFKLELIDLVRNCGGAHAEKSKILHGVAWELMATFGQGTTRDAAAIERLRLALKKARLLKRLFQQDVRWTFKAASAEVVKREKLSAPLMRSLLLCFVTSDRTPTLDVRKKKAA